MTSLQSPTKTKMKSFIQRHQLVAFFVLAYAITWGSIFAFLASKGFRLDEFTLTDGVLIFLMMALGPSTSSIVLHAWLDGRKGLGELFGKMRVWRVGVQWYAVALLTVPVLTFVILSVLSITVSPSLAPNFLLFGLIIGVLAGFLEELGWTGFALPRLLNKHNALTAGFILGVLWAVWHMFADYVGNINTMGSSWFTHYFVYWILGLVAYRILMTWVYVNTKSLLLAQLMHASYTGWQVVLTPTVSFENTMLWQTIFVAGLWLIVALVVVTYGVNFVRTRTASALRAA